MATFVALVIWLLISLAIMADINLSNESSFTFNSSSCIEREKQALLMFKRHLHDPTNRLVSWVPDAIDCCKWIGVVCDNTTGHVFELRLGVPKLTNPYPIDDAHYDSYQKTKLEGKINPCLSNLKHLRYLDLSNNAFEGMLPFQLGNLSNLQTLNLGDMGYWLLYVDDLQWLSGFSLLKHLDLNWINMSSVSNVLHAVNSLPSLEELNLSGCGLSLIPPFLFPNVNLSLLTVLDLSFNNLGNDQLEFGWVSNLNSLAFLNLAINDFDGPIPDILHNLSTSLRHLDLSSNSFNSSIPDWIFGLSGLEVLRIGGNHLQGEISSGFGSMTSLNKLDLSWNELEGKLPTSMKNLCYLRSMDLSCQRLNQSISEIFEILSCSAPKLETLQMSSCQLFGRMTDQLGHFKMLRLFSVYSNSISGSIPTCIGQLANLEDVYIENNLLEGVVSELHFANHTKLRSFYASDNSLLILKVHPNWVPPFQLEFLELESWHIGPSFPLWLRTQKHLVSLDISNSKISDSLPRWFWGLFTHITSLNLSHNKIRGQCEYIPENSANIDLDFSFNCFSGPLPRLSVASKYDWIDLSSNDFSGSLFHLLCHQLNNTMTIKALSLSKNLLSGEIPDCWTRWPELVVLKLDDNKFTGRIPRSMGTLNNLQSLNLYRNNLDGEIPLSLKSCRELKSIMLGENTLDGHIPGWLGHSFPNLLILNLRSNRLLGNIPDGLCDLRTLQILDLANNTLSGRIPRCIHNFTAMAQTNNGSKINSNIEYISMLTATSYETASVIMKGQFLEYSNTLNLVRVMDFSSNNLSGAIPQEVTTLEALQSLNLSHNSLNGKIPKNIGAMQSLESLDLSENRLIGSIPTSMSNMTFLSRLNLSYNNLTGEIPSSTQLQSFNASSYIGNNLCGPPLEDCIESGIKPSSTGNEDNKSTHTKRFKVKGLYISMTLGFIVGFWSIVAPLVISRRWRFTYYGFLEQMWRRLQDFFKV